MNQKHDLKPDRSESAIASFLAHPAAVYLALAGATFVAFWPVLSCDFVNYDDPIYVTGNDHVLNGMTWGSLRWAFTKLEAGFWHPLTWMSHMLDCELFGLRAGWHHLSSLLVHVANVVLLFEVFRRMTGALWRSVLVAALFALHPLHVESVAWIAERKDLLSTFFAFFSLLFYARYVQETGDATAGSEIRDPTHCDRAKMWRESKVKRSDSGLQLSTFRFPLSRFSPSRWPSSILHLPSSAYYFLSLVFFACGLMSKAMVVTLPLLMLLLDCWPLRRLQRSAIKHQPSIVLGMVWEKLPFFAAGCLAGVLTVRAEKAVGALISTSQIPLASRGANATLSSARYLLQTLWPMNLAVPYPFPASFSVWWVGGAAMLLVGISVAVLWVVRQGAYLAAGWCWYVVALLPVAGWIQVGTHSHADRYTYVPLIGVFVILVWGAAEVFARWQAPRAVVGVAAGLVLVLCATGTRAQLRYWHDSGSLFRHAVAVTRGNAFAYNSLGGYLSGKGFVDEAIEDYRKALRINPNYVMAYNNLGVSLIGKRRFEEAIGCFRQVLRLAPNDTNGHIGLGIALAATGKLEEAIRHYTEALRIAPDSIAHNNLGLALASSGRLDEAVWHYTEAMRLAPSCAVACNLGNALVAQGRLDEAIDSYHQALQLNPGYAEALNRLGYALSLKGRLVEAVDCYEKSLRNDPGNPQVHLRLGCAMAKLGRHDDAVAHLTEAVRLKPDYAEAKQQLRALGE